MDTKELFEQKGQGHVFQYWESLDEEEKRVLQEQADEIDLGELDGLVKQLVLSKKRELHNRLQQPRSRSLRAPPR